MQMNRKSRRREDTKQALLPVFSPSCKSVSRNGLSFTLCALLLATGCTADSTSDSNNVTEGGGSSVPGQGPDGGLSGFTTGVDITNLSQAIITPILRNSPTLPPLIIIPPALLAAATCGNGALDDGELCDPSVDACCAADCAHFAPRGTVCRAANGACDVAETCSGDDAACPEDGVASAVTECRAADGPCDVADRCDGTSTECPADAVAGRNRACRAAAGVCDVAEHCDGSLKACPDDGFALDKLCRTASVADACDAPESCDGTGPDCPADGFLQGNVCRPAAAGGCDIEEVCTGDGPSCPADGFEPDATACNAGLGQCSMGTCCPSVTAAGAPHGRCRLTSGEDIVFVTSGDTHADIGIDGADALCNKTARSANLAGSFHAWISSGAISRVPQAARDRVGDGPYARVDGAVVADSLTDLVQGSVQNPIELTEWGVQRSTVVWTGTKADGTAAINVDGTPFMCGNWAVGDTSAYGETGLSVTNKPNWTADTTHTCDEQHALYCFADDPLAAIGTAFVTTSYTYFGDGFGGSLDGADSFCNNAAAQAGFKGTFVAWLSDSMTDARDRIPDRPYQRIDGAPIASSLADLTDGTIQNPINIGEDGGVVVVSPQNPGSVLTGSDSAGRALHHCRDWTPADVNDATLGDPGSSDANWTSIIDQIGYCGGPARFYCFQTN